MPCRATIISFHFLAILQIFSCQIQILTSKLAFSQKFFFSQKKQCRRIDAVDPVARRAPGAIFGKDVLWRILRRLAPVRGPADSSTARYERLKMREFSNFDEFSNAYISEFRNPFLYELF